MGEFENREQGFEAKFAHDQEIMFKAKARRDALAGRWAVGQLGLSGAEADAYLQSLVALSVRKDHEQAIVQKLLADFAKANIDMNEHRLRGKLTEFMEQASAQVQSEVRS